MIGLAALWREIVSYLTLIQCKLRSRSFILAGPEQNIASHMSDDIPSTLCSSVKEVSLNEVGLAGNRSRSRWCIARRHLDHLQRSRGLWVSGEPARRLINSWTSSARDTYQLLVAVGHQCNDKPLNAASGSSNNVKIWLDARKRLKKTGSFQFIFFLYTAAVRGKTGQRTIKKTENNNNTQTL